jgi:hypothetical protein
MYYYKTIRITRYMLNDVFVCLEQFTLTGNDITARRKVTYFTIFQGKNNIENPTI